MNNDNQQVVYCEDGENRVYFHICEELCSERFYKNHSIIQTNINNIRKRDQLNQ